MMTYLRLNLNELDAGNGQRTGNRGVVISQPAGTWWALTTDYIAWTRTRQTLSDLTRHRVGHILRHDLAAWLDGIECNARPGQKPPKRISPDAPADKIAAAVNDWLAAHGTWSQSTRCTNLGAVRPFLKWAALRGCCTGDVAGRLVNPRKPKPVPRALTDRAIETLLAVIPDARGRAIVLLEAQCGLRRAEVTTLRWPADLDLTTGSVLVQGKGSVERVVYASDETLDALACWLRERGPAPGPFICRYTAGKRIGQMVPLTPTWIGVLTTRWLHWAGLKTMPRDGVGGHSLRHSAATRLLRDGVNIRVVQEALGHASIITTARYLRVDNAEVRSAMQSVSYGTRRLRAVNDSEA